MKSILTFLEGSWKTIPPPSGCCFLLLQNICKTWTSNLMQPPGRHKEYGRTWQFNYYSLDNETRWVSHHKHAVGKHIHGVLKAQTSKQINSTTAAAVVTWSTTQSTCTHIHSYLGYLINKKPGLWPRVALTIWKFRTQRCCVIVCANEISHSMPKHRYLNLITSILQLQFF